jgi:hypothetical protein
MITVSRLVDENGEDYTYQIQPFEEVEVEVVSVSFWPNNDPEDPSPSEMRVTYKVVNHVRQ